MDLSLVRSLRDAMRTADLAAAAHLQLTAAGNPLLRDRYEPRSPALEGEPHYAPRRVIHPEPRVEPRETVHVSPRVEWAPPPEAGESEASHASCKPSHESPFQPPWKVLPWPEPEPSVVKVKRYARTIDITGKGRMIDLML